MSMKKTTFFLPAAAIALTLACAVAAQETKRDSDFMSQGQCNVRVVTECETQGECNIRALKDFESADAKLKKVFDEELAKETSSELREAFIAAHRAWLFSREADGHYESVLGEGGSARSQYVNERMTYLTRLRIYQLQTPFAPQGWK